MFHDTLVPCAERRNINMKKKLVSSIIFLSIIFFVGCQRNYTGNNKDRENLKIEKKEKLKECTITEFYNGIAQKDSCAFARALQQHSFLPKLRAAHPGLARGCA